jgi:hypothetical protein
MAQGVTRSRSVSVLSSGALVIDGSAAGGLTTTATGAPLLQLTPNARYSSGTARVALPGLDVAVPFAASWLGGFTEVSDPPADGMAMRIYYGGSAVAELTWDTYDNGGASCDQGFYFRHAAGGALTCAQSTPFGSPASLMGTLLLFNLSYDGAGTWAYSFSTLVGATYFSNSTYSPIAYAAAAELEVEAAAWTGVASARHVVTDWRVDYSLLATPAPAPAVDASPISNVRFGRYVSLFFDDGNQHTLNIGEIEVYGASGQLISSGRPVTQSSILDGYPAAALVDGDYATFAHTYSTPTFYEVKPWLEIDLGADVAVSRIVVQNRRDCCTDRTPGSKVALTTVSRAVTTDPAAQVFVADLVGIWLTYNFTVTGTSPLAGTAGLTLDASPQVTPDPASPQQYLTLAIPFPFRLLDVRAPTRRASEASSSCAPSLHQPAAVRAHTPSRLAATHNPSRARRRTTAPSAGCTSIPTRLSPLEPVLSRTVAWAPPSRRSPRCTSAPAIITSRRCTPA